MALLHKSGLIHRGICPDNILLPIDGTARLTRAFGQSVGGTARRYDFDFDAPASDPDDLHPVCGNFLEELILPDTLQVIGSCAFYNCRRLRLLTVGAGNLTTCS